MRDFQNIKNLRESNPFVTRFGIKLEDIPYLYVPFDELMNYPVEQTILEQFQLKEIGNFFAITGGGGRGKSSILNYLLLKLSHPGSKVLCVKLYQFTDEIKDSRDLLKLVITKISQMVSDYQSLGPDQKEKAKKLLAKEYSYTSEEKKSAKYGLKAWFDAIPFLLGFETTLVDEIATQSGVKITESVTLDDLIEFTNQLIGILKAKGINHIIILLDETDKIRDGNAKISSDDARKYFSTILHKLEKTHCSYLFVMNEQYGTPEFKSAVLDNYFSKVLVVPQITKKESLRKIIEKRTTAACGSVKFADVWDEDCIDLLFDFYTKNTLRQVMDACSVSVDRAYSDSSESVSVKHVNSAIIDATS
ncbi:MAG: hypothetical protein ACYDAJ_07295 [Nitrosotalea sp.]